jgi:hypothetical protein
MTVVKSDCLCPVRIYSGYWGTSKRQLGNERSCAAFQFTYSHFLKQRPWRREDELVVSNVGFMVPDCIHCNKRSAKFDAGSSILVSFISYFFILGLIE